MQTLAQFRFGFVLCSLVTCTHLAAAAQRPDSRESINPGLRGVYFVPNRGQWADSQVLFGLHSRGLDVAFQESALTMHLAPEANEPNFASDAVGVVDNPEADFVSRPPVEAPEFSDSHAARTKLTLAVSFPGSNAVLPVGEQPQHAKFNYFVGGADRATASNVPSFGAVAFKNLYGGIDLLVRGNADGVLKYEFHVAPGADWSQIRIAYDGIESLCVGDAGDLHIGTAIGTLRDAAPMVWQSDRAARPIAAHFELIDDHTYRIVLDGACDPTCGIIIDPDVQWLTYLGGTDADFARDIKIDADGSVVMVGTTASTDFEGSDNEYYGGPQDAFLARIDASGALAWMTYVGGDRLDAGSTAMISGDSLFMSGYSYSANLPLRRNNRHGGPSDVFLARFDQAGMLQWTTYLGGYGDDFSYGIAKSGGGDILICGPTSSTDFEGRTNGFHGGANDAFIASVSVEGAVLASTYYGGTGNDQVLGMAADAGGSVVIAGSTDSTTFEGQTNEFHGGTQDAFALKIGSDGVVQWMTYCGGEEYDRATAIAVDASGNAYLVGYTTSLEFEGRIAARPKRHLLDTSNDAYSLKISPLGTVQWMRYLGGSGNDTAWGVAVSEDGDVFTAGHTNSTDFEGRLNSYLGGTGDAFLTAQKNAGEYKWMIYHGGSGEDLGDELALANDGTAVVAGFTSSLDIANRTNSYHGGQWDATILQIRLLRPELSVAASCPSGGPIEVAWTGATSDGQVALAYARNSGIMVIPDGRVCAGTTLGLGATQFQIVFQGRAGADGSRTLNANAGPGACGGYLQLLDLSTCSPSNAVRIE